MGFRFDSWRLWFAAAGLLMALGGPRHPAGSMLEMLQHPDWFMAHALVTLGYAAMVAGLLAFSKSSANTPGMKRWTRFAIVGTALQTLEMAVHTAAMVDAGNALLAAHALQDRAEVRLGDAHALPLDSACTDAALAVNTLYFWDELKFPFAELTRVLRPGGRLCLAFGDAAFMRTLPFTAHGFHLHELADVESALRSAGLTVQAWRTHRETGRSNDGREVTKHFHLLLARR